MAERTISPVQTGGKGRRAPFPRPNAAHAKARDAYKDVPILQSPTWNNDIAAYFFLGGVSSGAYLLGAILDASPIERRGLARTAHLVSFAAMLPCPVLLIDDLGMPSRFLHMLRIFKPSSPMSLGSWALVTHGGFSTLNAARQLAEVDRLPLVGPLFRAIPKRALSFVGMPSALTLGGYTGVLIGTTSIPVWSESPFVGGLFMASAVTTGVAASTLAAALAGQSSDDDTAMLSPLRFAAGCSELALLAGYFVTARRAARPLLRGREGLLTLIAAISSIVALVLDVTGKQASPESRRTSHKVGALLTLIGGACLRWAFVRAGHVSAANREDTLAATKPSKNAPGWGPSRTT